MNSVKGFSERIIRRMVRRLYRLADRESVAIRGEANLVCSSEAGRGNFVVPRNSKVVDQTMPRLLSER